MPAAWPIAQFLFKLLAPSIPDLLSTVSNLKQSQEGVRPQEETMEKRLATIEQTLAQQLERVDTLTRQISTLHLTLRRTLILSMLAGGLAMTGLVLIFYS